MMPSKMRGAQKASGLSVLLAAVAAEKAPEMLGWVARSAVGLPVPLGGAVAFIAVTPPPIPVAVRPKLNTSYARPADSGGASE